MVKHFLKVIENFRCRNCGTLVKGTGYTNHCPKCLYSRHVDEEVPGDRASVCKGLMKPVGMEMKKGEKVIIHKCVNCGKVTRNKSAKEDEFEEMLKLS